MVPIPELKQVSVASATGAESSEKIVVSSDSELENDGTVTPADVNKYPGYVHVKSNCH